ncbi:HAMP domain-containing sensor histidine kinase [Pseudonocardia kunmingensis]|uniref:histidine kinase n=1 Tax=Pseudonocardia kunmingensis TaxID=630975 RepID=A0A543DK59_9PSEU|nr:HAMP domain-containing sensor histidine kinase [Pseudonocardia kunmingensis]TQM09716.1 two-component system OmpR family sensor kinase [Pseudonocardia kunmingensis]
MTGRSLRTRLVAAMLLLLAIASTVIAVVTAVALREFLIDRLDDELRASNRVLIRAEPGSPPTVALAHPGPRPPDSLTAVVRDGNVLAAGVFPLGQDVLPVPAVEYPDLAGVPAGAPPRSVDLGELGDYRVVATRTPIGDVIVSGMPEAGVQATVTRLVLIELVVTGVALAGAGTAAAMAVRHELRPLERVATTAARVSALPLDRGEVSLADRVPDADPRTEVGQVGAALNRMLDHVGSALEARHASEMRLRQFVADASHELRTPLAAISGYTELTRRGELPADAEYSLTRIASQAERMTTLVEDLLLLARLDAGRPLEGGEVDLTRLVVDAVADAHAAGPDHDWRLAAPEHPLVVPGDASRLAQVLANLLANARAHTPPGTSVTVALAAERGDALISVADNGPGIAPELLPNVFERFARGSTSRSRDNGSTGLGLAIVRAVVTAHRGTVAVTSHPGRTEFTVRLPTGP